MVGITSAFLEFFLERPERGGKKRLLEMEDVEVKEVRNTRSARKGKRPALATGRGQPPLLGETFIPTACPIRGY
jgi:hypothetical protein